jgi:hypothetical protein
MMMIMNLTICVLQPNNKMGRDCSMHGRHGLCIQKFSHIATTGRLEQMFKDFPPIVL